jgi:hypothetical protein
MTRMRSPRNHARRVEDLRDLEARGVLTFLESRRPDDGPWEYVVHVAGEPEPQVIPTGKVDTWLACARSILTAIAHGPIRRHQPQHEAGAHRTNRADRAADRAGHPDHTPNGGTQS